jgi:hypothetical protein
LESKVGLEFTEFCSLHDGDGTKPATDAGASVGKTNRINKSPSGTIKRGHKQHMEAFVEGLSSCEKRMTACQLASEAGQDNSKSGPKKWKPTWLPSKSFRTKQRPRV